MATAAVAQESDTDRRIKELERQIDIITRELESIKNAQKPAAVAADTEQYGLGVAASKVYRTESGVSIGGYGEFLYQNFQSSTRGDVADALRAVIYTGYKFNEKVLFNSEIEFEHASTGRGGEASVEFAYLDYLARPGVNARAGLVLVPMGLINEQHEPTAFFGAARPLVERNIIPATWRELGAGVFGDIGRVSYRTYVVTGLRADQFSASGIRGGRQSGAQAVANDWALVGRADWHPFEGTLLGGSLYSGDAGQTQSFGGRVTLAEVHADSKFRGVSLRALAAQGTIADAAEINKALAITGNRSVGKSFGGWYVEGGYDFGAPFTPFARYERLDTQRSVPTGFLRNPANDQKIFTLGLQYKPVPQTVIKVDWQNVDNRARTGVDQFNIGLGYIF